MEELIRRLKNTAREEGAYAVGEYGHSYKLLTHSDAEEIIKYLNRYYEISKIIDEFNATQDSSPMVERAYAEYIKTEKVECFDQILDLLEKRGELI